jgi:hypothetical protein
MAIRLDSQNLPESIDQMYRCYQIWYQAAQEGRNLSRPRDFVLEHRARFIQEGTDGEEGLKPEDAPHIERIAIREGVEEV